MIKKQREAAIKPGIYEIAVNGLFTALIAVGAFIKISIPVQPFPMNFTLQFFFVSAGRASAGRKAGVFLRSDIFSGRTGGSAGIRSRGRPCLSAASHLWVPSGICSGCLGDGNRLLPL